MNTVTEIHPIKKYRTEANLSQKELAAMAGITEQVILKAEQGLYPTLPPSVLRAMRELTGKSFTEIEDEYEAWNLEELTHVVLPVSSASHTSVGIPPSEERQLRDPMLFKHWMHLVCDLNDVPTNVNAFCKLLKIHPYVIQKWTAGKMKEVPAQLLERVSYIRNH